MKKFNCTFCGEEFRVKGTPKCCPMCGSENIIFESKARETAMRLVSELEALKERHDRVLEEYAEVRAEIEYRQQILRKYKQRGILTAEEIPTFNKPKVSEYLKEYRSQKRKEKSE